MHDDQCNTFDMLLATRELLVNAPESKADPGLAHVLGAFVPLLARLETLADRQSARITGVTRARNQALALATEAGEAVAGRVFAYASENKLGELAARVRLNRRAFAKLRLVHRPAVLQQIHDVAVSVLPALAEFGVTDAVLADLQQKITLADQTLVAPRSAIIHRKVATTELAEGLAEMNRFLKTQLDPVMLAIRQRNPLLFARYRSSRHVIRYHGRRRRANNSAAAAAPISPPPPAPDERPLAA